MKQQYSEMANIWRRTNILTLDSKGQDSIDKTIATRQLQKDFGVIAVKL